MKRVVVHIDRLVLNGIRHADQHAFAAGLQQELGRVVLNQETVSLLTAMRDLTRLQLGRVHIEHGSTPKRFGERVAHGIGKEIKR